MESDIGKHFNIEIIMHSVMRFSYSTKSHYEGAHSKNRTCSIVQKYTLFQHAFILSEFYDKWFFSTVVKIALDKTYTWKMYFERRQ